MSWILDDNNIIKNFSQAHVFLSITFNVTEVMNWGYLSYIMDLS